MNKTITIWFGVNKDNFVIMHTVEPTRNVETGKWESKYPFVNSVLYNEITKLVAKSKMTWESEAQCLTFQIAN